jgi:hypothetical protein
MRIDNSRFSLYALMDADDNAHVAQEGFRCPLELSFGCIRHDTSNEQWDMLLSRHCMTVSGWAFAA